MAAADLTSTRLRELLDYNPETGVFRWKAGRYGGAPAGTLQQDGYRRVRIAGVHWKEHRLAWFYVTGTVPPETIDHINGVKVDNRFANLRFCSIPENQQNLRKALSHNKTGLLGVTTHPRKTGPDRYSAKIKIGPKSVYLGVFETPELAHQAYLSAKRDLHPFGTL